MADPDSISPLTAAIDAWLPQTQCTQCGYPRCLDYAHAVAGGEADINQCPPGGDATIRGIAALLDRDPKPLDPDYGVHRRKTIVRIDEPRCIGCTLCIQACPVDAIVGASKRMHTVIENECTGCELCLPACPVDCIDVHPAPRPPVEETGSWTDYSLEEVDRARRRTRARLERLGRRAREQRLETMHRRVRSGKRRAAMKEEISAAVARVRARRRHNHSDSHEQ